MKKILLALACLFVPLLPAKAQSPNTAIVVTTCGTPPFTYPAGTVQPAVQDVSGKICDNGGGATSITLGPGSSIIGKVGIDQTTPGTTNGVYVNASTPLTITNLPAVVSTGTGAQGASSPRFTVATDQATNAGAAAVKGGVAVVNGGSTYQTIAASQTGQTLQSATGAAGDYLSHCDIYPTSTSPGAVQVFDSTNVATGLVLNFAGGASSVSNLAPIPVPVGAVSTAGAWKATTGASVSVVCFGKFS